MSASCYPPRKLAIWSITACMLASICQAEVYKWTDENGRVHYGDRPQGSESEKLDIKTSVPKPDAELDNHREKQRKLLDVFAEERAVKNQEKAAAEKKKKELKQQCAERKDYLRKLKRSASLYELDEKGNRQYLSNESHDKKIADVEKQIQKYCK